MRNIIYIIYYHEILLRIV